LGDAVFLANERGLGAFACTGRAQKDEFYSNLSKTDFLPMRRESSKRDFAIAISSLAFEHSMPV
jgi:hypothetical protein